MCCTRTRAPRINIKTVEIRSMCITIYYYNNRIKRIHRIFSDKHFLVKEWGTQVFLLFFLVGYGGGWLGKFISLSKKTSRAVFFSVEGKVRVCVRVSFIIIRMIHNRTEVHAHTQLPQINSPNN